jgi:hypothetical protein
LEFTKRNKKFDTSDGASFPSKYPLFSYSNFSEHEGAIRIKKAGPSHWSGFFYEVHGTILQCRR